MANDQIAVKLPDMVFSIYVFEKILSINGLLESLSSVGCVMWGWNKCEDRESMNDECHISLS